MSGFENYASVGDFMHDVSRGKVSGAGRVTKFGRNKDVDPAASEAIWTVGGNWINPTTAETINVVSTSANDAGALRTSGTATETNLQCLCDANATFQTDGVTVGDVVLNDNSYIFGYVTEVTSETELQVFRSNGALFTDGDAYRIVYGTSTGASVILVDQGLDNDYLRQKEFVIMNGLTPVPTTKQYLRITRAQVVHIGGNPAVPYNVGNINFTGSSLTIAQIPENAGQTQMACYTTPANEEAYLVGYYGSVNKALVQEAKGQLVLGTRAAGFNTAPLLVKVTIGLSEGGNTPTWRPYSIQDRIPPRTDVVMVFGEATQTDSDVSAGFDLLTYKIPD